MVRPRPLAFLDIDHLSTQLQAIAIDVDLAVARERSGKSTDYYYARERKICTCVALTKMSFIIIMTIILILIFQSNESLIFPPLLLSFLQCRECQCRAMCTDINIKQIISYI